MKKKYKPGKYKPKKEHSFLQSLKSAFLCFFEIFWQFVIFPFLILVIIALGMAMYQAFPRYYWWY